MSKFKTTIKVANSNEGIMANHAEYEAADKKDGTYTPNFYSIREERDSGQNDAWAEV